MWFFLFVHFCVRILYKKSIRDTFILEYNFLYLVIIKVHLEPFFLHSLSLRWVFLREVLLYVWILTLAKRKVTFEPLVHKRYDNVCATKHNRLVQILFGIVQVEYEFGRSIACFVVVVVGSCILCFVSIQKAEHFLFFGLSYRIYINLNTTWHNTCNKLKIVLIYNRQKMIKSVAVKFNKVTLKNILYRFQNNFNVFSAFRLFKNLFKVFSSV